MMELIENIKRPVKVGELFLVPCAIKKRLGYSWETNLYGNEIEVITPVINHPHSDRENGQNEVHYHVDYRFVKHENDQLFPTVINRHSKHKFVDNIRIVLDKNTKIEHIVLPVINEDFTGITPVKLISKSKLKRKCIHKGKCPHRGYDLSQTKSFDGKITCPLHGLKFNEITKELIQ